MLCTEAYIWEKDYQIKLNYQNHFHWLTDNRSVYSCFQRWVHFKSSAPNGQSPQCCVDCPPLRHRPPTCRAGASHRLRPPFCAEPTLQKRERIKTTGGEGRNFTPSLSEERTNPGLSVDFNERINKGTQVKQHYFLEKGGVLQEL